MNKINEFFTTKRMFFLALFAIFAFITQKINFSGLVGAENQFFTLFQFFGPIAGAFLGPVVGVLAVFFAEAADFLVVGKELTWINIMRLAPMLLATYFFATKGKATLKIAAPLISIALFVLHPVGREVWFFALYWTIPVIMTMLPKKYSNTVPAKALGATFTAHAVGGALWIWTIPMTAGQWIGLIPVVAYERLLFAAGIAVSYVVLNIALDKTLKAFNYNATDVLNIDKKLTLKA